MDQIFGNAKSLKNLAVALSIVITFLYALPFLYLILTSLKAPIETIAVPPQILPDVWSFENYRNAIDKPGVIASIGNSVEVAVLSSLMAIALGVPAAFAAVRIGSPLTQGFLMVALVVRMIPPIVIGAPLAMWASQLGLYDTTLAVAVAHTAISLPLVVWLMAGFFEAIPRDIEEAALLDGCSRITGFFRITLPVTLGGVSVAAIFAFLSSWNEFIVALLLTSTRAQTTPIAIANFQTQFGLDWGSMTALAVLYSAPVVLLTLVLQRYLISGMTLGAVKG